METRKNTYYKGCHTRYMSGMPLPTIGESNDVLGIHFIDCRFHPECNSALFKWCHFTDCTGLPCLNMEQCYIIRTAAGVGGLPIDIDNPTIIHSKTVDRLSYDKDNCMYLYRYCAIVELDAGRNWPAMDNVMIMRTIDND